MALNGWHRGERSIHNKLGHDTDYFVINLYHEVEGDLPEDHALVFTQIPFIAVATTDASGRPWGSILVGQHGEAGFIHIPRYSTLQFRVKVWPGDPIVENLEKASSVLGGERDHNHDLLLAGVALDLKTRKRTKFAGRITKYEAEKEIMDLEVFVNQSILLCPKYIVARNLQPVSCTRPTVIRQNLYLADNERLPDDIVSFILDSDTAFLGTSYVAPPQDASQFPSHIAVNERSGHPGFIRVMPSDGRTLVLPDYSGNRIMTSLGNIEVTSLASMTFVSFVSGAILYITGTAQNHFPPSSYSIMPFQRLLTTIRATGYVFLGDAFPLRQQPSPELEVGQSPSVYTPPVRYLAEEAKDRGLVLYEETQKVTATLSRVHLNSTDIATFTWETSDDLEIQPGQAVILNFLSLLGPEKYAHMAPYKPSSVNDDRLRTWTVVSSSSASLGSDSKPRRTFSLIIREKPNGAVTGALFAIIRKLLANRPDLLEDARPMQLTVWLAGVTGDFVLPRIVAPDNSSARRLLWVAGGIGITPFLGMLNGLLVDEDSHGVYDIHFIISTREPSVSLSFISSALSSGRHQVASDRLTIHIDVFSHQPLQGLKLDSSLTDLVTLQSHAGRLSDTVLIQLLAKENHTPDTWAYVCGPKNFEKLVMDRLRRTNIQHVKSESFAY